MEAEAPNLENRRTSSGEKSEERRKSSGAKPEDERRTSEAKSEGRRSSEEKPEEVRRTSDLTPDETRRTSEEKQRLSSGGKSEGRGSLGAESEGARRSLDGTEKTEVPADTELIETGEDETAPLEFSVDEVEEPVLPDEPVQEQLEEPKIEEQEPFPEVPEEETEPEQRKHSGFGEMPGEDYEEEAMYAKFGQGDTLYDMLEEEGEGLDEYPPKELFQETSEEEMLPTEEKRPSMEAPPPEIDMTLKDDKPKVFVCSEEETSKTLQMESYCCQQIKIPPMLPHVLKTFTKAAIRTQPRDLLRWAVAYFKALANDETPPSKDRLEYPTVESPCGLTKGLLRVLHKQLGKNTEVLEREIQEKWMGLCLDGAELTKLLHLNSLDGVIDWTKFVAVAAASIVNDHVVEAMCVFCDTVTEQPDGVDPYVPYEIFVNGYAFLAEKLGVDMRVAENACQFLRDLSKANFDLVGPKDFMAPECPPLF